MSTVLEQAIANLPLTRTEERIRAPVDPWSDTMALKIAVQDFSTAEAYRTQNQDWRWRVADELYLAWVAQKYWEGTKIPRASIPVYLSFEQVEALLAKLMGALFAEEPWFQADPGQGVLAAIARFFRDKIHDQLDEARVREIVRRGIKSGLIYGNGITELSWQSQKVKSLQYVPRWKTKPGQDPQQACRVLERVEKDEIQNKPVLNHVSIKDFYIDPNCTSPQIEDAEYCCVRAYKNVGWLDGLRDNKEFNIPSKDELALLAIHKPAAQADVTKSIVELMRFGAWAPQNDKTSDPAGKRVEVIARWSKDRLVWVLNREICILNKPNPYGFMPFYDAFYADVPDRFYALGICDVMEGEQRFMTSLRNARIDELALSIHAPVQYKRGLNIPSYQLRVRPGQMIQVEEPGKDYVRTEMGGITNNAYIEDNAAEQRAQKITGLSDLISSGVPSAGGNAAARTATGVGAQVQAGNSRIQGLLETLEDVFIEPMLNGVVKLNILFPPVGTPPQQLQMLKQVKLFMRASAKMRAQTALLQQLPLVLQSVLNPAFLQHLAQSGQTVNFTEFLTMILDATGFKNRADLIVPLSQQQLQQMQQQSQQEQNIKLQMQQQRIQSQEKLTGAKLQHATQLEQMKLDTKEHSDTAKTHVGIMQTLIPGLLDAALGGGETNP